VIAIVVIGVLVIAIAGLNAWVGRHRQGDSLERHERALNALRDLAEHPEPIPAEPPPTPTDHVHILDERPAGAPPQRRRARRPPAKSRPSTARTRARALESRPTTAHLPTQPTRTRQSAPEQTPPDPLPAPEPIHLPEPLGALAFDDTVPAPPSMFSTRHARPRFELPRIRVSARAAAVAALAAVTVVLVGTITAVGITAGRGSSPDTAAPPPRRAAAPPTTVRRTPPTTAAPRPAVQVVANATGNGTVTVPTPFTLTLATTTSPCWVSVDDNTGHTIFTGPLQPGQRQNVTGDGPLTVRLGNSPAVQISVNGAPLDMTGVGKTASVQFGPPA
jgi:cytoskeletal protein RodZ